MWNTLVNVRERTQLNAVRLSCWRARSISATLAWPRGQRTGGTHTYLERCSRHLLSLWYSKISTGRHFYKSPICSHNKTLFYRVYTFLPYVCLYLCSLLDKKKTKKSSAKADDDDMGDSESSESFQNHLPLPHSLRLRGRKTRGTRKTKGRGKERRPEGKKKT